MTDPEIIEAIATRLLEWKRSIPNGLNWELPDGSLRCAGFPFPFNPLKNPADSKLVREKLAERFIRQELHRWGRTPATIVYFRVFDSAEVETRGRETDSEFWANGDTEERAVAIAALRSVGIEV